MIVRKSEKYRVYPTRAQEARLIAWESGLRFLWNVAHEQRLIGMRRLARRILDAGWGVFAAMLRYKAAWAGGQTVEVPARYSSQTCAVCGCVDAASRNGERFCCTGCGHVDHADVNASKVLKQRRANRSVQPTEAAAIASHRSGKVGLRVPRRSSQAHGLNAVG